MFITWHRISLETGKNLYTGLIQLIRP